MMHMRVVMLFVLTCHSMSFVSMLCESGCMAYADMSILDKVRYLNYSQWLSSNEPKRSNIYTQTSLFTCKDLYWLGNLK